MKLCSHKIFKTGDIVGTKKKKGNDYTQYFQERRETIHHKVEEKDRRSTIDE